MILRTLRFSELRYRGRLLDGWDIYEIFAKVIKLRLSSNLAVDTNVIRALILGEMRQCLRTIQINFLICLFFGLWSRVSGPLSLIAAFCKLQDHVDLTWFFVVKKSPARTIQLCFRALAFVRDATIFFSVLRSCRRWPFNRSFYRVLHLYEWWNIWNFRVRGLYNRVILVSSPNL